MISLFSLLQRDARVRRCCISIDIMGSNLATDEAFALALQEEEFAAFPPPPASGGGGSGGAGGADRGGGPAGSPNGKVVEVVDLVSPDDSSAGLPTSRHHGGRRNDDSDFADEQLARTLQMEEDENGVAALGAAGVCD